MRYLHFWLHVCLDNDWLDLIDEFVSIVETSAGDNQRAALSHWITEVDDRLDAMPPDESTIIAKNPAMQVGEQFGTEI